MSRKNREVKKSLEGRSYPTRLVDSAVDTAEEVFEGGKAEIEKALSKMVIDGKNLLKLGVVIDVQVPLILVTIKASAEARVEGKCPYVMGKLELDPETAPKPVFRISKFHFEERKPIEAPHVNLAAVPPLPEAEMPAA